MIATANPDKPTLAERYIGATRSSNLRLDLRPDAPKTDADLLLAAGYAAAGNARSTLALDFYRLKATGDLGDFGRLCEITGNWLLGRSMRGGRKKLRGMQAQDLAKRVLFWWMNPVCTPCDGRGHPLAPNSTRIDYGHDCPVCHGTAQYPIHAIALQGLADEARWLADELDQQCRMVFEDMARVMAARLDF